MAGRGNYWAHTFEASESLRDRQRSARQHPGPDPEQDDRQRCARGDWCEERTVVIERGERIVTAALSPRPFCGGCTGHIRQCLDGPGDGLPKLYARLAREIGEERHALVTARGPRPAALEVINWILGGQMARALQVPAGAMTAEVAHLASVSMERHLERHLRALHTLETT